VEQSAYENDHQFFHDIVKGWLDVIMGNDNDFFIVPGLQTYIIGPKVTNGKLSASYTFVLDDLLRFCDEHFGSEGDSESEQKEMDSDSERFLKVVHKHRCFHKICLDFGLLVGNDYEVKGVPGLGKKKAIDILSDSRYRPGDLDTLEALAKEKTPAKGKDKVKAILERGHRLFTQAVVRTSRLGDSVVTQGHLNPPSQGLSEEQLAELGKMDTGETAARHAACLTKADRYDIRIPLLKVPRDALAKFTVDMATDPELRFQLLARQVPIPFTKDSLKALVLRVLETEEQPDHPGPRFLQFEFLVRALATMDLDSHFNIDEDEEDFEEEKAAAAKKKKGKKKRRIKVSEMLESVSGVPSKWHRQFSQVMALAPLLTETMRQEILTRHHQKDNKDEITKALKQAESFLKDSVLEPELLISEEEEYRKEGSHDEGITALCLGYRCFRSMTGKELGKIEDSDWERRHIVILKLLVKEVDGIKTVIGIDFACCTCRAGVQEQGQHCRCWHLGAALYVLRDLPRDPLTSNVPQSSTSARNLWVLLRHVKELKTVKTTMTLRYVGQYREKMIKLGEKERMEVTEVKEGEEEEEEEESAYLDIDFEGLHEDLQAFRQNQTRRLGGAPAAAYHYHPSQVERAPDSHRYHPINASTERMDGELDGSLENIEQVRALIEAVRGKREKRKTKEKEEETGEAELWTD